MTDPGLPMVTGELVVRWGEADSNPLADIQRWKDQIAATPSCGPTRIIVPEWLILLIARRSMSKRAFRRWRARSRLAR